MYGDRRSIENSGDELNPSRKSTTPTRKTATDETAPASVSFAQPIVRFLT